MNDTGGRSLGILLKQFLSNPASNFNPLYRLCTTKAVVYLSLQKSRGRILPESGSDSSRDLEDLAHQLLERFFLDSKPPHFRKILDYFNSLTLLDVQEISADCLENMFLPFFYQQLKQGLSRERRWVYPERSSRQKTIENNLRSEDFAAVPGHPDCITSQSALASLRTDAKPLTKELLGRLAWESIQNTKKMTETCREFFRRLAQETDHQNFVSKWQLIYALTMAVERLALETSPIGSFYPSPEIRRQHVAARKAADRAFEKIREADIGQLLKQGIITSAEADGYVTSCRLYLDDRCDGNGTDKLAEYFRAGFPTDFHALYDKTYKYRFLKLMDIAEQYYTEELDVLL